MGSTTAAQLRKLAAQPYPLSYARATSTDPTTITALHALRTAANDSGRNILWLSTTDNDAAAARTAGLGDVATTLDDEDALDHLWQLHPNAIIVIDNPAEADPTQLAALAATITSNNARVIILDPDTHHAGPSTPALRLLAGTLPWTVDLTPDGSHSNDHYGAPTPAIALADRLRHTQLSAPWTRLLADYDTTTRAIRSAHRLQLTLSWHTTARSIDEPSDALEIDD